MDKETIKLNPMISFHFSAKKRAEIRKREKEVLKNKDKK